MVRFSRISAAFAALIVATLAALATTSQPAAATEPSTCTMNFAVYATTFWGQNVYIVGNRPELGNWNPAKAVPLSAKTYPEWRGSVTFPMGASFEYKYIKKYGSSIVWEGQSNRPGIALQCGGTYDDIWQS